MYAIADEQQMSYNNTIAVHPTKPDHVVCGGVDLHRTTNGGQTWRRATVRFRDRGATHYAHADSIIWSCRRQSPAGSTS